MQPERPLIIVVCAGRRFGKTVLGGALGLAAAWHGGQVGWVAPTYKQGLPLWRFVEEHLRPYAPAWVRLNQAERMATFWGGGTLTMYSADNIDAIRGNAFDVLIPDEAAMYPESAWTDAMEPTLADRSGIALLPSTPRGRNWYWRLWQAGRAGEPNIVSWQAPSSANPNPRIRAAAEAAKGRVSERTYRQEWLAEFVEHGGAVFRLVGRAATAAPAEAIAGHSYVIGVDWGRRADASAFAVWDLGTRTMVWLEVMEDVPYPVQIREHLVPLVARFGGAQVLAESNGVGMPQIEWAREQGLSVTEWMNTDLVKDRAIQDFDRAILDGAATLLNDPRLVGQMEGFEVKKISSRGIPVYGAPEGMHDDLVIAAAIGWQGCQQTGGMVEYLHYLDGTDGRRHYGA